MTAGCLAAYREPIGVQGEQLEQWPVEWRDECEPDFSLFESVGTPVTADCKAERTCAKSLVYVLVLAAVCGRGLPAVLSWCKSGDGQRELQASSGEVSVLVSGEVIELLDMDESSCDDLWLSAGTNALLADACTALRSHSMSSGSSSSNCSTLSMPGGADRSSGLRSSHSFWDGRRAQREHDGGGDAWFGNEDVASIDRSGHLPAPSEEEAADGAEVLDAAEGTAERV